MPRGGKRPNTKVESNHLFKPRWNNKKTVAIRVPEVFKDVLLGIARHLDKTKVITEDDQEIIDDVVNCFRHKKLWIQYRSRLVEIRQEKIVLLKEIDNLTNQSKQNSNQNKYKIAAKCFDEFLNSQNLNIEELAKSRKGTKKHQLYEINKWFIEQEKA